MVYQDFSPQPKPLISNFQIPPLADRLLAFVFDLVIFTPVFSFILANLFRKVELMYFVSPDSVEFLVLCGVSFVFVAILTILFQTLFLILMGATPGKYFFKIQIVSMPDPRERIRFTQAFLRSFLWVLEAICLCIPFLEVVSEPMRRPLHDRAAGTMAVTLKKVGDQGPSLLESQFVRQILLVTSLGVFVWTIFFVGHFYKLAVRGEFRKSELENDNYLCSSVTSSLKSQEVRMDKALALFLADEISEECLASEADFVLWTPNDTEKSWAYLAKGLLKKYDTDRYQSYLEQACTIEENGPACEIAQYEADPSHHPLPVGTQTASILQVTQDFEKGRYENSEKGFLQLAQVSGFESFAQQGLVKSFWAENKIERAKGAYQNVVHQMSSTQSLELSAWICHEELDHACNQQAVEACEDLKQQARTSKAAFHEPFAALALIREKECRQTGAVDYIQFHDLLEEKKDVLQFVRALAKDANTSEEERSRLLQDLALRKEPVRPIFIRRLALQQWIEMAKTESEFARITQFLKDKKVRDLSWVKIYEKALKTFLKNQAEHQIKEIVDLPSEEMIQTYRLQNDQVRAHYLARNYEKAWGLLHNTVAERQPASESGAGLSLEAIRQDLQKRWSSQGEKR